GRTVMVVEDDADVREAIAEVLSDCEYKPVHAANGAEALHRLRTAEVRPCVILLDMMMPTMDGWQFRAEQKSDPSVSDIPGVVRAFVRSRGRPVRPGPCRAAGRVRGLHGEEPGGGLDRGLRIPARQRSVRSLRAGEIGRRLSARPRRAPRTARRGGRGPRPS